MKLLGLTESVMGVSVEKENSVEVTETWGLEFSLCSLVALVTCIPFSKAEPRSLPVRHPSSAVSQKGPEEPPVQIPSLPPDSFLTMLEN